MKIYCISGIGTAWENKEEILCVKVLGGLFYCPDLKVVFQRNCEEPEKLAGGYYYQYSWDYATFPCYDEVYNREKENPFWRNNICRIDAPKTEKVSDEDI